MADRMNPQELLPELLELAATQPRIKEDATITERGVMRFGHNFVERFSDIRAIQEGRANDDQLFYVRMVKERFGYDLLAFSDRNSQLCNKIFEAIEAKASYDRLLQGFGDVTRLECSGELPAGSAQSINVATGHPLGIVAIAVYYWDKLNPLLEEAYQLMSSETLNAPFLTK